MWVFTSNRWVALFARPSVLVLVSYILYVWIVLSIHHYDATVFIQIGGQSLARDPESTVVKLVREIGFGPPYWKAGFDGQFYYYLALDPLNAWRIFDTTGRYQRILYPMIVRSLSLGYLSSIPFLMIAVNLAAIFSGTELLAHALKRLQISAWYSLAYGFHIGQLVCLRRDLPEPLMYAFVLAAIYSVEARANPRLAGILFSLALFTKEPAILFIVAYALGLLLRRKSLRNAAVLLAISVLPYVLFQLLLLARFGQVAFFAVGNLQTFSWVPFQGIAQIPRTPFELISLVILIMIPATLAVAVFLRSIVKRAVSPLLLAILLNALFLVFLPPPSYEDVFTYGRLSLALATAWIAYAGFSQDRRMLAYAMLWTIPFHSHYLQWML